MKRTKRWLKIQIEYEKSPGIHTYHNCACGRNRTRVGKCWQCLEEELKRLK